MLGRESVESNAGVEIAPRTGIDIEDGRGDVVRLSLLRRQALGTVPAPLATSTRLAARTNPSEARSETRSGWSHAAKGAHPERPHFCDALRVRWSKLSRAAGSGSAFGAWSTHSVHTVLSITVTNLFLPSSRPGTTWYEYCLAASYLRVKRLIPYTLYSLYLVAHPSVWLKLPNTLLKISVLLYLPCRFPTLRPR